MGENIGEGRPLRVCDLCGGVDDHPRHTIAGAVPGLFPPISNEIVDRVIANAPEGHRGRLVRDLMDTGSSERHKDCCREAGCPEGLCGLETANAEDLRGADLLEHIMSNARNGE